MKPTPATQCVQCGKQLEAATPLRGHAARDASPHAGDLTLCLGCGKAYQFGASLELIPVDLDALPMDPAQRGELRRAQAVIQSLHGRGS